MNARCEDLVEEGLDAITSGRTSIDAFLADHPVEADDLRPVLEAAVAVNRAMHVSPRPAFHYAARADFADRIQARSRGSWFGGWTLALRPMSVGLFAVVIASSLGFGTVAASEDATPGQPLYRVKLAQESVRLAIARDEMDRADLRARFTERRVEELGRVVGDPVAEQRTYLARQIAANLQTVAQAAQQEQQQQGAIRPETRAKLTRLAAQLQSSRLNDPDLLRRILAETPTEHRPMLTHLLQLAQEEYQRTLKSVDVEGGAPVRPAPESRPAFQRNAPDGVRPTPGERASDVPAVPPQRSLDRRPTLEPRAPVARPSLDARAPTP